MPTYVGLGQQGFYEPYQLLQQGLAHYTQNKRIREQLEMERQRLELEKEREKMLRQVNEQHLATSKFDLGEKEKDATARDALTGLDFSKVNVPLDPLPPEFVGPPTAAQASGSASFDLTKGFGEQDPLLQREVMRQMAGKHVTPPQVSNLFDQTVQAYTGRPVIPQAPDGMLPAEATINGFKFEPAPPPGAIPRHMTRGGVNYDLPSTQTGPDMDVVIGPDGKPVPGFGKDRQGQLHNMPRTAAPTENQSNAKMYASRMAINRQAMEGLEKDGYDPASYLRIPDLDLPLVGNVLSRSVMSQDRRLYDDAMNNWIAAALRKESGAAISKDEYRKAAQQYFPMPGDGEDVLKHKARLRQQVEKEMSSIGELPQVGLPFDASNLTPPPSNSPPAHSGPIPISTSSEFAALPPGTRFIWTPTGQEGTKK